MAGSQGLITKIPNSSKLDNESACFKKTEGKKSQIP